MTTEFTIVFPNKGVLWQGAPCNKFSDIFCMPSQIPNVEHDRIQEKLVPWIQKSTNQYTKTEPDTMETKPGEHGL